MAFLSGKNNNFKFNFPKVFMPQEIEDKYSPVLNRIPGNMCTTVLDFINYSIMSVELEVNQIALLSLIVISENSSVDKIELA